MFVVNVTFQMIPKNDQNLNSPNNQYIAKQMGDENKWTDHQLIYCKGRKQINEILWDTEAGSFCRVQYSENSCS